MGINEGGSNPMDSLADTRGSSQDQLPVNDFYRYTSRQIEREESLINRRISWMVMFQGFLFASIAILSNTSSGGSMFTHLNLILPILAIMVSLLTFIGILGAYFSIFQLQDSWNTRSQDPKVEAATSSYPPFTPPLASLLGQWLGLGLPLLFVGTWLAMLLLRR
jgi:hypothetical protein